MGYESQQEHVHLTSSPKMLQLEVPKNDVGDRCEAEGELKSDITTIFWISNQLPNGTQIPLLCHAH